MISHEEFLSTVENFAESNPFFDELNYYYTGSSEYFSDKHNTPIEMIWDTSSKSLYYKSIKNTFTSLTLHFSFKADEQRLRYSAIMQRKGTTGRIEVVPFLLKNHEGFQKETLKYYIRDASDLSDYLREIFTMFSYYLKNSELYEVLMGGEWIDGYDSYYNAR